jgi:hypothetical protein
MVGVSVLVLLSSCKKNDLSASNTAVTPSDSSAVNAVKDSALFYARDIYLWYNQIPSAFNAHSYADPSAIMTAIRQYSNETGFTQPVDRWSFGMNQQDWNNLSSGVSADFGLNVFFLKEGDLRVKSVESASPAGIAGVRRGWRITGINDNTDITTANASFIIQNIYQSKTATVTFQKPDSSVISLNLVSASYQEHPVILDSVYSVNAKTIGYLSFNSFLGDTTEIYNQFARVFNKFNAANVNDVIVDLRYNGGGYVNVAQKLVDYLAPSSASGGLMMTQKYNDKYTQYNESTSIQKAGSLNLGRIFFIVSQGTASASELVINNLKPYMNVQLVGPSKTYGKPVGFFPIPVGNWYIFPVSFRSANKNGEGNYFNGLALNSQVPDGLDKDWGDLNESDLSNTISYITTGVYKMQVQAKNSVGLQVPAEVSKGNSLLDQSVFKGMISPVKRIR